jgi:heme exporter protein B
MSTARVFLRLVFWDILREVRRKETVFNMTLFAVLILFLADLGLGPLFEASRGHPEPRLASLEMTVGPILFWITILFAGTVGVSQSFAAEREGSALEGVLVSPVDPGLFYLAKVAATWIYVMVMELFLLGAYGVLFRTSEQFDVGAVVLVLAVFSLGYMACGVLLAAMTSAMTRGSEVVLRILLFPLLLPVVYLTLQNREATFGVDISWAGMGPAFGLHRYLAVVLAIDAIYLVAGYLIFPKIVEE